MTETPKRAHVDQSLLLRFQRQGAPDSALYDLATHGSATWQVREGGFITVYLDRNGQYAGTEISVDCAPEDVT